MPCLSVRVSVQPSPNDGVLKDINVRMIPISSGDVRGVFSQETRKTR